MITEDIKGGVSPLKARKGKGVAGEVGKKATATRAQIKAGLTPSGKVPSGKGYMTNLESLTAGTRVTGSLAAALGAKGPGGQPKTKKDDFGKTDEFGDIQFKTTEDIVKSSGNEFADNCYNEDGSKKHGHSFMYTHPDPNYNNGEPYEVACEWSGTASSGPSHFDYEDKVVNGEHQYREKQPGSDTWGPWLPTKGTEHEKK